MKIPKQISIIVINLCICLIANSVQAQKDKDDPKIKMEAIKEKCKDLPLEKRIRLTVTRFTSTAGNAPRECGENMATMLESALSQVNCFNILESKSNLGDMTSEIDMSNSEYTNAESAVEKGQMKLAQIVVTGEVTEYNEDSKNSGALGISKNKTIAKVGFVLKVMNPKTREILKSTSFNVESEKSSGGSTTILFVKTSKNAKTNAAMSDALEKGVIKAVEYLASEKDNIPLPSEDELNSNLTVLTVNNLPYSQKASLIDALKSIQNVKSAELAGYDNNKGTINIKHIGSTEDLADQISKKYPNANIGGFGKGRFTLTL